MLIHALQCRPGMRLYPIRSMETNSQPSSKRGEDSHFSQWKMAKGKIIPGSRRPGLTTSSTVCLVSSGKTLPFDSQLTPSRSDCEKFQTLVYGWTLRLVVPVNEICRPHGLGRDDDRLVGIENVRVWDRGSEMRFMAHLIQEKGKRRKKYLEFDSECSNFCC